MKRAECTECCKGGDGMTDRQFVDHLRDLLLIAKSCSDLEDFIAKLKEKISSFGR